MSFPVYRAHWPQSSATTIEMYRSSRFSSGEVLHGNAPERLGEASKVQGQTSFIGDIV